MKTQNLIVASLVFVSFATPAQAELSSSVKVRIRNSSNSVYPCNAGVAQNPKSISTGVDFIRGSWVASQHSPAAPSGQGIAVGGSKKNGSPDTDFATLSSLLGQGTRPYLSYNQLLPEETMYNFVVGQNLNAAGLEVNLSSDTYDSAFYITFCFKPSIIGHDPNGPGGIETVPMVLKFIHARATHSAVPGAAYNYATDSGLKSMVEIKCRKFTGGLVQHYTPNAIDSIENLLTPFSGNMTIDMAPSSGIQIGSSSDLINGVALNSGELPDDCRVRFYFIETAGTLRPHALTSSDIQVDLEATIGSL